MPITTPTILDQISAEKTKISERLARLDADRAKIATQLIDLETAERVLTRVSKTPPARRPRLASAAQANAAKSSHRQVGGTRTQCTKPGLGRACSCPGHRQNPTGTLRGMSQRSPEPCR